MELELKCIPYVNTYGSEGYKKLINKKFSESYLANVSDHSIILFEGWQVKDRGNYKSYTNLNNNRYMIEMYQVGYTIITSDGSRHIPVHPQNLDQFITDCQRCGLDLYWNKRVLDSLKYNEILEPKTIEEYHDFLLEKLGKTDIN